MAADRICRPFGVRRDPGVAQDERNFLSVMNMLASVLWMKGRGIEALKALRELNEGTGPLPRREPPTT